MKYHIQKADGSPVDPEAIYFVLRLDKPERPDHRACRAALYTYAREVRHIDAGAWDAAMRVLNTTPPVDPSAIPTFERVKQVLVEHGAPEDNVTPEALLFDNCGLDSLDTIEVVMDLEKEFFVEIHEDEADRCRTVKDVVNLIDRLTGKP